MGKQEAALTLIGGPTVLIELNGMRLLTDPTFDPPQSYQSGSVTLSKLSPPAIAADAVGQIDAVLLSHDQHFDNLDYGGRSLLGKVAAILTTQSGAKRLGGQARGLAAWETTRLESQGSAGIFITATAARHGPPGIEPLLGEVTGFALGLEEPGDAIYITGDTVWYEGVSEVARRFSPRLVLIFAGAARPRGSFHVTMDSNDAIETAHAFAQARIGAAHTEGWGHFTESQDDLERSFATLGLSGRLQRLAAGRRVSFDL